MQNYKIKLKCANSLIIFKFFLSIAIKTPRQQQLDDHLTPPGSPLQRYSFFLKPPNCLNNINKKMGNTLWHCPLIESDVLVL